MAILNEGSKLTNGETLETTKGSQDKVDTHANSTNNPHNVTKSQVGLGNVSNTRQATKSEFDSHAGATNNPHNVTTSQIGAVPTGRTISTGTGLSGGGDLSSDRTLSISIATQSGAQSGTNNATVMTPLRTKQAIDNNAVRKNNGLAESIRMASGNSLYIGSSQNELILSPSGLNSISAYFDLSPINIQHQGRMIDSIAEQGSNSNGHYIRYHSGIQICWHEMRLEGIHRNGSGT